MMDHHPPGCMAEAGGSPYSSRHTYNIHVVLCFQLRPDGFWQVTQSQHVTMTTMKAALWEQLCFLLLSYDSYVSFICLCRS